MRASNGCVHSFGVDHNQAFVEGKMKYLTVWNAFACVRAREYVCVCVSHVTTKNFDCFGCYSRLFFSLYLVAAVSLARPMFSFQSFSECN